MQHERGLALLPLPEVSRVSHRHLGNDERRGLAGEPPVDRGEIDAVGLELERNRRELRDEQRACRKSGHPSSARGQS